MIIEICGQAAAVRLVREARDSIALISITATENHDVIFPENDRITAILRLRLNDLTEAYDDEGIPYGRPLPELTDFDGLKAFVSALDCDRLIVHCWEGASRSAAVATAVFDARGGSDTLKTHGAYAPNPRIYMLACREMGIPLRGVECHAIPDGNDAWTLER